jgi:hypothetical protein
MAVQRLWERIKDLGALKSQLVAIRDRNAHAQVCEGLVDLRSLTAPGGPLAGLGFRDHYRDRGWARPTLARVLAVARERLRREFPGRELTVGDVAQPGCGQIVHVVVIRLLEGAAAEAWLAAARPHAGALTSVRMARAADFPLEAHRFADPGQRIRVVSTARALSRSCRTRVCTDSSRSSALSPWTSAVTS